MRAFSESSDTPGLVRALRPAVVVETGVATGITSAYILAGMRDNGVGKLHSVDLPAAHQMHAGLVGAAVPTELRDRWIYHWGAARRLLPAILQSTASRMDLFIHDSDHRYAHMRWELQQAWSALTAGGWLLADDVDLHTAFGDVAAEVGAEPLFVSQDTKPGWTGLLRKVG